MYRNIITLISNAKFYTNFKVGPRGGRNLRVLNPLWACGGFDLLGGGSSPSLGPEGGPKS